MPTRSVLQGDRKKYLLFIMVANLAYLLGDDIPGKPYGAAKLKFCSSFSDDGVTINQRSYGVRAAPKSG